MSNIPYQGGLAHYADFIRFVPTATVQMLVVTLVHTVLDYGNGVLAGLPAYLICQLQSVLNTRVTIPGPVFSFPGFPHRH